MPCYATGTATVMLINKKMKNTKTEYNIYIYIYFLFSVYDFVDGVLSYFHFFAQCYVCFFSIHCC